MRVKNEEVCELNQEQMKKKLKLIKKVLMSGNGYIRLGSHTKERLFKRGYTKGDLVCGIMTGSITRVQTGFNHALGRTAFTYTIEGQDRSHNPVVVILSEEGSHGFLIVTVMPPIDHSRFHDCIG